VAWKTPKAELLSGLSLMQVNKIKTPKWEVLFYIVQPPSMTMSVPVI